MQTVSEFMRQEERRARRNVVLRRVLGVFGWVTLGHVLAFLSSEPLARAIAEACR